MTRTFITAVAMTIATMVTLNANAQRAGHRNDNNRGYSIEMNTHNNDRHAAPPTTHNMTPPRTDRGHATPAPVPNHGHTAHAGHAPHHVAPAAHHFDRHGYLHGWEGRVRYEHGRYGYLRGHDWYWYDTYYEPTYYFAHPVTHFGCHYASPTARAVVTAVASTAVIGTILAAIAH